MSMRSYRPDLWRLTGTGIIFPHWLALLVSGSLFTLLLTARSPIHLAQFDDLGYRGLRHFGHRDEIR